MPTIIDGTAGITFPNSTVQASAGQVLQVVQMTYATVTSVTGTSYVDSGLTLAITPKFSTSKILITTCLTGMFSSGVNGTVSFQRILRGATAIIAFDGSGTFVSNGGNGGGSVTFMYLDSPATTSATTYKLQVTTNTSGTVTWNNTGTNSSITLMEIAA